MPVGYAFAGPLVDHVFEPAMRPDGALAGVFGDLVGTGAGAGVAAMFLFTGVMGAATSLAGYLVPSVREVDERLPDHDHDPVPS